MSVPKTQDTEELSLDKIICRDYIAASVEEYLEILMFLSDWEKMEERERTEKDAREKGESQRGTVQGISESYAFFLPCFAVRKALLKVATTKITHERTFVISTFAPIATSLLPVSPTRNLSGWN